MKHLPGKILAVLAVFVAVAVALHYLTREPSANGHTLSEWLETNAVHRTGRDNRDVTNAVRAMGAKAIPILTKKMRVRDHAWEKRLDNKWGRMLLPRRWFNKAFISHLDAAAGFAMLGTQAVVVLPEFAQMVFDTNNSPNPAYALGYFGPEAWPVLRAALTNVDPNISFRSVLGLTATPEMARLAMPEIPALWSSLDPKLAKFLSARCLAVLPKSETWPLTLASLNEAWPSAEKTALDRIADDTSDPKTRVPILLRLLKSTNLAISMQAESLLYRIDPAAANARATNANLYKASELKK